jgi:tetratricopeptide (TPR) repeat protein
MQELTKPRFLAPIEHVVRMENHDAAYRVWREAGVRQRILVHVDAHHDMWWVREGGLITIANFICPALKEDMIREVFWVVPEAAWETARARRPILRHLKAIVQGYPGPSPPLQIDDRQISAVVLGKSIHVLPLGHLPRIEENVLLDIDVDYLVIPRVPHGENDRHAPVPWCWPDRLLARLGDANLCADLATIVYSVEGGYTPLKWKYLGDELALRLREPGPDERELQGTSRMRAGALAAYGGDFGVAEADYRQAENLLPDSAAPCFHLAHLYLEVGRPDAARELYRQALARDPSYRTAFNSAGVWHYWDRRFPEARREHQRTLALDAGDAHAHLGLGRIAADEKRWEEAETSLRTALTLDGTLPDAWRVLGKVLANRKRAHEAIRAYQESLKLVLHGHKPLMETILTQPPGGLVLDPDHCAIHVALARLQERTGALAEAITGYRFGIAGGEDRPLIRFHLLRLYLRRKQWRQAMQQTWPALRAVPLGAWQAARRGLRQVRQMMARVLGT